MDTAEELRMNLASLQRIDPYIINIKESASQVMYTVKLSLLNNGKD